MSQTDISWAAHLSTLSAHHRKHGEALKPLVAQAAMHHAAGISDFIFLPEQNGPSQFEDAAQIFDAAFAQMLLRKPLATEETPLLFVGYHVATRFTGSRFAQGFLLSDQAVYVQDDFSVLSDAPLPQAHALPHSAETAPAFVERLVQRFKDKAMFAKLGGASPEQVLEQITSPLLAAVQAVLGYHRLNGSLQVAASEPISPTQFVAAHGLGNTLLLGSDASASKKLAKVAAKFQIPAGETITLALADFPFLGGAWGTALTAQALYTRDLMENPLRLPLADLEPGTLRYSDDGKEMRVNGNTPLFFPNHIKASVRDELLELLRQQLALLRR